MDPILKLGDKMNECKKHLHNQGYTYGEADEMTKIIFNETEMKHYGVFDVIPRNVIKESIAYLDKEILQA